ncbi:MAG: TetR/AcrR family transcriptional regulator [Syntrophomonadaceae bacterium]|nr:TetR/AcrR family transcriptional regulator [Syntrophomonadaceae bacterium]
MGPVSPQVSARMQEKRRRILECAFELYAEKGYVNTPVKEIIDKSGFGTGTFYKYFSSKEDVLKTLLSDFLDQIITSVNEYFKTESDLYLRFVGAKLVILDVFIKHEKLSEIYSRVAGISDGIDACLKEFDDKFVRFTAKNIRYGIKQGVFRDLPVEPIANTVLAVIKHAVYRWIVLKDISKEEMIDMVKSILEFLAAGLDVKNGGARPEP